MKEKINVYIQYPWKFSSNTYYKNLINFPPKNIKFLKSNSNLGKRFTSPFLVCFLWKLKFYLRKIIKVFFPALPLAIKTKNTKKVNLIHCAHCLSKNKNISWVADFEYVQQMWFSSKKSNQKKLIIKLLKRNNCKKILPWTNWGKKTILKEFPEIKNKIETVYPGVPIRNFRKKKHEGINLLFIGREFYSKGGLHVLETFDKLTKKYPFVNGTIISIIPKKIIKKYSQNTKLKIFDLISQEILFKEIYPISDVFVYPGYSDSFGFAIPEAMSFGLPVVSVEGNSRKELIKEGRTGFIIENKSIISCHKFGNILNGREKVLNGLFKQTELLINNPSLRKKISINCLKEVSKGIFSLEKRNKKLKKIYSEALK